MMYKSEQRRRIEMISTIPENMAARIYKSSTTTTNFVSYGPDTPVYVGNGDYVLLVNVIGKTTLSHASNSSTSIFGIKNGRYTLLNTVDITDYPLLLIVRPYDYGDEITIT